MRGGDENAGTGPQRNRDGNQRFNVSLSISSPVSRNRIDDLAILFSLTLVKRLCSRRASFFRFLSISYSRSILLEFCVKKETFSSRSLKSIEREICCDSIRKQYDIAQCLEKKRRKATAKRRRLRKSKEGGEMQLHKLS